MSPHNSASHFTLPRTQACFPRPIVFFCLGDGISLTASAYRGIRSIAFCLSDGISLTASAYRGIRSNANSADHNVTHTTWFIPAILFVTKCKALFVFKMSQHNSASHFTVPRTQACFPRPFFCFVWLMG